MSRRSRIPRHPSPSLGERGASSPRLASHETSCAKDTLLPSNGGRIRSVAKPRLADHRASRDSLHRGSAVCSIDFGDETLGRFPGSLVARIRLARRKLKLDRLHVLVGNLIEQMPDAVEPGSFLVIGVDDVPWRLLAVGVREHHVLGLGILHPTLARFHVHRAELPALDWISHAL